jgi:aspartyl-tRNA(Asn)/glutamyl-tRNA(Gln) amidotransferase subunit B
MAAPDKYKLVIGLEVHVQLLTASKAFAPDSTLFGSEPNTQVSPITLAHPGTLPKLNKKALEFAMKMGLACHSEISRYNIWDRKNYFYPDLPKGYQLTQDRTPVCKGGYVAITKKDGTKMNVQLNRIHLEEDAGKSVHLDKGIDTLLDFNRAGTALIEIVTEPVMHEAEEAGAVLNEIRKLVRYLEIGDGNMEEGSLRCDANISVMLHNAMQLGKKVEVKNMNSVRNVQRAIEHEFDRQVRLLELGEPIVSETRTFNADNGKTYGMRTKEELNDYRYFPDPDVCPVVVSDDWLSAIQQTMPALPEELLIKLQSQYGLPEYDARVLTESKELVQYFEALCQHTKHYKAASNWLMVTVKSYLHERNMEINKFNIQPRALADLIELVDAGKVSHTIATQKIFAEMLNGVDETPLAIAQRLNVFQESDSSILEKIIAEVLFELPLKVEEYQKGKKGIISMFMGEVMKRTQGKADPKLTNQLLIEKLKK